MLVFDDSSERICNSKAFVDFATAGIHRGLSTIYPKHNLFHESKRGRDVQLQNTHILLFKSPRDVMQVSTLIAHLGFQSELTDWYQDATSVPFSLLVIDLSPRTDDPLRFCTNTGSIPSKFYNPDHVKQSNFRDDEYTKSLYTLSIPRIFPRMRTSPPSVLSKRCYGVPLRTCSKSDEKRPADQKKTSPDKNLKRGLVALSKKITWEHRRDILASEKVSKLRKAIPPPTINPIS